MSVGCFETRVNEPTQNIAIINVTQCYVILVLIRVLSYNPCTYIVNKFRVDRILLPELFEQECRANQS